MLRNVKAVVLSVSAAALLAACTVTVQSTEPTTAPPEPPATAATVTCGAGFYMRSGRYRWRGGRWNGLPPRPGA